MDMTHTGQTDGETREVLIKSHFAQRIAELTNQLQMADSKAVHYNAEVCSESSVNKIYGKFYCCCSLFQNINLYDLTLTLVSSTSQTT